MTNLLDSLGYRYLNYTTNKVEIQLIFLNTFGDLCYAKETFLPQDKFHAKLVNYASEVLAINPKDPGPLEMVTLYQLGSVLLTILKNSPSQVLYYKEHFSEEFK